MKIPKLKGGSYFCLRAAGLLIAGATVIYFVCDNSVSNNEHTFMGPISKDSPLERLIKWKLVGLTVYTGWIYGVVMEEPKFLVFVLILWFLAVLYSLFHLIIASAYLIHSLYSGAHEIIDKEIASFCDIFLVAAIYSLIDKNSKSFLLVIPAFFLILLSVHWLIFKLMQEATVEETEGVNEGKSLLNKGRPILLNETHNKELSTNP